MDVERVEEIDKKEFQYVKKYEFLTKDPKNYVLKTIKINKKLLKKFKKL